MVCKLVARLGSKLSHHPPTYALLLLYLLSQGPSYTRNTTPIIAYFVVLLERMQKLQRNMNKRAVAMEEPSTCSYSRSTDLSSPPKIVHQMFQRSYKKQQFIKEHQGVDKEEQDHGMWFGGWQSTGAHWDVVSLSWGSASGRHSSAPSVYLTTC